MAAGQGQSAENLAKSIASGVVSRAEIESLVENGYIPNLKILSCVVDSHHVELYSHALVGLDTLEALVKKMHIRFEAQTPQEVSTTIAKVNKEILDKIKNKEFVEMVDLEQH